MSITQDAAPFFSDFGQPFERITRGPHAFEAIVGSVDAAALGGHALGRTHSIVFATHSDLRDGDHIQCLVNPLSPTQWSVREPMVQTDGVLSTARLEERHP